MTTTMKCELIYENVISTGFAVFIGHTLPFTLHDLRPLI
jgi:hypothetical protein